MSIYKKLPRQLPWLLIAIGLSLLLVGLFFSFDHDPVKQTQTETQASALPSTTSPTAAEVQNHSVPADQPRYITISKINVHARVKALGTTLENQIAAPDNVYDAGWFNQSSKPGMPGAVIIDGHVSSESTEGVFYNLKSLKPGDTISIEKGDGTVINYIVNRSQTYSYNAVDMPVLLKPTDATKPGLNLVTCTGKLIKGTNDFDQRLVVFASQQ